MGSLKVSTENRFKRNRG